MTRMLSLVGATGALVMVLGAIQSTAAGPIVAAIALPDQRSAAAPESSASERTERGVGASRRLFGLFESGAGQGISVPVNRRMSVGLGYQYLTEERMVFEVAETGGMEPGYNSHRIMLRAKLRF